MDLLRPPAQRLHLSLMVDVGDDDLDDDDEGDGEEHARRAEDFAAKDDAKDDGDGMEVEGFADEGGIDDVVVDLCECEVEERGLQGDVPCGRGGRDCAECGGNGRAEDRDELADAGEQGEDGGIREVHDGEVGKDDESRDDAHDELAADVDAQGAEEPVKEAEDTSARAVREEVSEPAFDAVAVLQEVEGDKDDDDEVHDFADGDEEEGERCAQELRADAAQFVEDARHFLLQIHLCEERHLLEPLSDARQLGDEALQRGDDGAREDGEEDEDEEEK